MITPETIKTILSQGRAEYKRGHELNQSHVLIRGCKLGAVFSWKGEYYVYVGVCGRNRTYPCMVINAVTRAPMKFTRNFFQNVREASEEKITAIQECA